MSELSKTQEIILCNPCLLQTCKLRPREGKDPSQSQGWWQQNQLDFESPGSMPALFPLHLTDAILLRVLFFSSLQEQHAEKKPVCGRDFSLLKRRWLHSAVIQVPAKAVFLHSIRQSIGEDQAEKFSGVPSVN